MGSHDMHFQRKSNTDGRHVNSVIINTREGYVGIDVSPQTCVPGIKESPHFCRDSDHISDYCTLKI